MPKIRTMCIIKPRRLCRRLLDRVILGNATQNTTARLPTARLIARNCIRESRSGPALIGRVLFYLVTQRMRSRCATRRPPRRAPHWMSRH